jgi:hypothetical protein
MYKTPTGNETPYKQQAEVQGKVLPAKEEKPLSVKPEQTEVISKLKDATDGPGVE